MVVKNKQDNAQLLQELHSSIIAKAKSLGADLVGIASVEDLKKSPSHVIYPKMEHYDGVGTPESSEDGKSEIKWPDNAKSVIVIAIEHNTDELELDWWDGKGTQGNRNLIEINKKLIKWLEESQKIKIYKLPYYIEKGGIFLKDAAVLAGLGCIGKNNLLVTPEFGPRVRLRALFIAEELTPSRQLDFDPCTNCEEYCRKACPNTVFDSVIYSSDEMGVPSLPSRNGCYSRSICNMQMEKDADNGEIKENAREGESGKIIKYCRRCELGCIVGKSAETVW